MREIDDDGNYTGELAFYAYGPHKADAIQEIADREEIDLSASYAYSDSVTDLPMLEAVGHPVAVNPDRELAREAKERDWEVRVFQRPVRLRDRVPVPPKGPTIAVGSVLAGCGSRCRRLHLVAARLAAAAVRDQRTRRAGDASHPARTDGPTGRGRRFTGTAAGEARRSHRPRARRQQGAQARVPLRRGGGSRPRHARDRRRPAEQPRPDDRRSREPPRPRLPSRARPGRKPEHHDGNLLLDDLLGATMHFTGARDYYEIETSIEKLAAELLADGRRPFTIPVGGASVTGVVAYALAIDELRAQIDARPGLDLRGRRVGRHARGAARRARCEQRDARRRRRRRHASGSRRDRAQARGTSRRAAGRGAPSADVIVDHDHFGAGYGGAHARVHRRAIRSVARSEGIFLDPVYSGKAMVAMLAWLRDGRIRPDETVVFWHTGGSPALFVDRYEDAFTHEP